VAYAACLRDDGAHARFSQLAQEKASLLPAATGLLPLPPFSPDLLRLHSNELPGQVSCACFATRRLRAQLTLRRVLSLFQPRRVVVSIYSDFTPGTNQAAMLLHWVRRIGERLAPQAL
jgi:hypothetical protein